MAGAATMVVIWGNILSFIGNVVALAVEVLVFDAFFPRNESRKKRWLCILLWCVIATFLSVSVGTKFGYTLKMLQEVALIYLFCVFLYQSRWDRRLFIVVTVYSVLFSYSHWFDELCMRISGFTYEEYIWNVPLYSIFFFLRCSFILAFVFLNYFTSMVVIIILYLGFVLCRKATFDVPDIMLGLGLSFLVFSTITGIQMPLFFKMGYTKAKLWSVIPFAVVMLLVVLPSFVSALSGILDFAQSHKELFAFACILTSCIIQFVSYHIAVIFYRKQR